MKKMSKDKKRLIAISIIMIGIIASLVSSVSKDWVEILANKKEIAELSSNYETLLAEEDKLKSEITKFQDSEYIVRYAKEKYLYSSDGEIIIRFNE